MKKKDCPIDCTGNSVTLESARVVTDYDLAEILEGEGIKALKAKERIALSDFRKRLSAHGPDGLPPLVVEYLEALVDKAEGRVSEPSEVEASMRRQLVSHYFAYRKLLAKDECDPEALLSLSTLTLPEIVVVCESVRELLRPYGLEREADPKLMDLLEGMYLILASPCPPTLGGRVLFTQTFNPKSDFFFLDSVATAKLFELSRGLEKSLAGLPYEQTEAARERLEYAVKFLNADSASGVTSPKTVSGGAPGQGKGGTPTH